MKTSTFNILTIGALIVSLLFSCGGVPEESSESAVKEKKAFSVEEVLEMVAAENDITRTMYTKRIVGGLKPQGLAFDEDWRDDEVEAGPLPALFLRGISSDIRKGNVPLGLYLGSDFPINKANKLEGKQAELFKQIKEDLKPQYFYDESSKQHTAMFADVAKAQPCVTCHNDHAQTPKADWKLGDVMGATTWQYPEDSLSYEEAIMVLQAYRNGVKAIYTEFLDEVKAFKTKPIPEIGDKWPSEGFFLPTAEAFIDSTRKVSAYSSMKKLLADAN